MSNFLKISYARKFIRAASFIAVAISLNAAHAADTSVEGKIGAIDSTPANGGKEFRVFLEGNPALCPGSVWPNMSYINVSDDNYAGLSATLLTAFVSGRPVTIISKTTSEAYCQITYAQTRSR